MTPFVSVFISYTFLSWDSLAEELEDPFGTRQQRAEQVHGALQDQGIGERHRGGGQPFAAAQHVRQTEILASSMPTNRILLLAGNEIGQLREAGKLSDISALQDQGIGERHRGGGQPFAAAQHVRQLIELIVHQTCGGCCPRRG
jgi:predicted membrane chloride channel (bestrophin family)